MLDRVLLQCSRYQISITTNGGPLREGHVRFLESSVRFEFIAYQRGAFVRFFWGGLCL